MNCPICSSNNIDLNKIRYPVFRHLDFTTMYKSGSIGRCMTCQSLFNIVGRDIADQIDNIYKSYAYFQSKQTDHKIYISDFKGHVTRSFLQAELIYKLLCTEKAAILDLGCFNGELLIEFDRRLHSVDLHGFDVNKHLYSIFPTKDNFHLWLSGLEDIDGVFDLICMSHSIMYFRDVPHLMKQIKRLIKPEGFLFIQIPDVLKNPCYILMGDQYLYYTVNILKNSLKHFGYECSVISSNWCPREIVVIAKVALHKTQVTYIEDLEIYRCVGRLDAMVSRLKQISSVSRIGILGTTVNAAFADSILGENVSFFADERDNHIGSKFRGKEVLHPRSLRNADLLVIPYGESSEQIRGRFGNEYRCRMTCI